MNKNTKNKKTLDKMINKISQQEFLIKFLAGNNIVEVDQIKDIELYERNGKHRGIIVTFEEKKSDTDTKILIDLKCGGQTIDQVYDYLYGIGKDCEIKLIVYSNKYDVHTADIPTANIWAVFSLILQLQMDDVAIALFWFNESTLEIKYVDFFQDWYAVNSLKIGKIPTQDQFMAETFWSVYFDSFNESFYNPCKSYGSGFRNITDWGYKIYIDHIIDGEIKLYWDENGVRYEVKQCDDSDEHLKRILDIEMPALKQRYGNNAVKFENLVGRLPRLYIQYSDTPFSWLYTATPRQITEFAHKMYTDAWDLRWQMEATLEKLNEKESA